MRRRRRAWSETGRRRSRPCALRPPAGPWGGEGALARLHLGTCGWSVRRETYFRRFDAVEVQQTFYEPPSPATLQRWKQVAPPGFGFSIKAWQLITHPASSPTYRRLRTPLDETQRQRCGYFRPSDVVEAAYRRTMEAASTLGAEVVLFQTPASFAPDETRVAWLRQFFQAHRPAGCRFVWEPRGPWPESLVRELCQELGLVHGVDPFVTRPVTEGFVYLRLHGIGGYRHRYSDQELDRLAAMIRERLENQEEVWCLFNNVTMAEDAIRLQSRL
ncbi:MAG TPA: DUF72 domain-containing protein [Limnochordales bacterium]